MEFVANRANKIEYMVWCVWITCQVHRVMQGFLHGGLKKNPAICSAFVHFLTMQRGRNVASGVGGQLKALAESVTTRKGLVAAVDGVAKEATAATKEATVCVGAANNAAVAAKDVISALYSKNNTLKC
jgi:hypothetical protein